MVTEKIMDQLAELEVKIADMAAQLEANDGRRGRDWERSCRWHLRRAEAKRDALLAVIERFKMAGS